VENYDTAGMAGTKIAVPAKTIGSSPMHNCIYDQLYTLAVCLATIDAVFLTQRKMLNSWAAK
jgi:hypothetical protein